MKTYFQSAKFDIDFFHNDETVRVKRTCNTSLFWYWDIHDTKKLFLNVKSICRELYSTRRLTFENRDKVSRSFCIISNIESCKIFYVLIQLIFYF